MAQITASQVKELRERTGAGMMECKKALVETDGDIDAAIEHLRKTGMAKADKKAGRTAAEGLVAIKLSGDGKRAAIVEVNCETDFVARNEDFTAFAKEVALHIAATGPKYVSFDEIPEADVAKEKEIFAAQMRAEGKPEAVIEKIVVGKIKKWASEVCLDQQPWFRDADKTVEQVIKQLIGTVGENIKIRRFVRWELGEGLD